jgi:hypothetical protein
MQTQVTYKTFISKKITFYLIPKRFVGSIKPPSTPAIPPTPPTPSSGKTQLTMGGQKTTPENPANTLKDFEPADFVKPIEDPTKYEPEFYTEKKLPYIPEAKQPLKQENYAAKKSLDNTELSQKQTAIGKPEPFTKTPIHQDLAEMDEETAPKNSPKTIELVGIQILPNAVNAYGHPLKPHETGHVLIGQKNTTTGTITIDHEFTSAKNNFTTGQPNPLISAVVNYSQEPKPQRMSTLETGRLLSIEDEGKTYVEHPDATTYLNDPQNKPKIETAIQTSPDRHHVIRHTKNDPVLYTEDGIKLSEEDTIDRTPIQSYQKNQEVPHQNKKDDQ